MFDPLDDLEAAIDKVAASEATLDLARLSMLVERVEFQRLRAVRTLDRSDAWQADGALTTAAWLRHRCRMTHGAAVATVRLARRLESLPAASNAFEAGEITRQHAVGARGRLHPGTRSGDRRGRATVGRRRASVTYASSDRSLLMCATRSTVMAAPRRPTPSTSDGGCTCRSCSTAWSRSTGSWIARRARSS